MTEPPNPDAVKRALEALGIDDPFVQIALTELSRDVNLDDGLPEPGSEEEQRLIDIGRLLSSELGLGL